MDCPICGSVTTAGKILEITCCFTGKLLRRRECPSCGLIFGPEDMILASPEEMDKAYERVYSSYAEGDTTAFAVDTFRRLSPSKEGKYLDFGCGRWSRTLETLKTDGYDVVGYDPYERNDHLVISDLVSLQQNRFDGIMSHNVIEHVQSPLSFFFLLRELLKPGSKMAHSTECYDYRVAQSGLHLFFFTGNSVKILCERTGFSLVSRVNRTTSGIADTCCVFERSEG